MNAAEPLSPTEVRLITLIADRPGATQEDLANELRVTARHVRRLLAREHVRRALDAAARAGIREGANVLGRAAELAAKALVGMTAGVIKASAPRVAAARAVLDVGGRLIDLVDLEARIQQLEKTGTRGVNFQ